MQRRRTEYLSEQQIGDNGERKSVELNIVLCILLCEQLPQEKTDT